MDQTNRSASRGLWQPRCESPLKLSHGPARDRQDLAQSFRSREVAETPARPPREGGRVRARA